MYLAHVWALINPPQKCSIFKTPLEPIHMYPSYSVVSLDPSRTTGPCKLQAIGKDIERKENRIDEAMASNPDSIPLWCLTFQRPDFRRMHCRLGKLQCWDMWVLKQKIEQQFVVWGSLWACLPAILVLLCEIVPFFQVFGGHWPFHVRLCADVCLWPTLAPEPNNMRAVCERAAANSHRKRKAIFTTGVVFLCWNIFVESTLCQTEDGFMPALFKDVLGNERVLEIYHRRWITFYMDTSWAAPSYLLDSCYLWKGGGQQQTAKHVPNTPNIPAEGASC